MECFTSSALLTGHTVSVCVCERERERECNSIHPGAAVPLYHFSERSSCACSRSLWRRWWGRPAAGWGRWQQQSHPLSTLWKTIIHHIKRLNWLLRGHFFQCQLYQTIQKSCTEEHHSEDLTTDGVRFVICVVLKERRLSNKVKGWHYYVFLLLSAELNVHVVSFPLLYQWLYTQIHRVRVSHPSTRGRCWISKTLNLGVQMATKFNIAYTKSLGK